MNDQCKKLSDFLNNPTKGIDDILEGIKSFSTNKYVDVSKFKKELNTVYFILNGIIKKIFPLFNNEFIYELFIEKVFVSKQDYDNAIAYLSKYKDLPKEEIPKKFADYEPIKNALKLLLEFRKDFQKKFFFLRLKIWLLRIGYFIILFIFGLFAAFFIEKAIEYLNAQKYLEKYFSSDVVWYIKVSISFVIAKFGADKIEEKINEHFLKNKLINQVTRLQNLSKNFNTSYDNTWRNAGLDRSKVAEFYYEYCVKSKKN